jgi:hypothetical protein
MLKVGRIALLLCADIGGASAFPGVADVSLASCEAQVELERDVAALQRTVRTLQSELLRTKTYGQAAPAADAAAASASTTLASTGATACEGSPPSDDHAMPSSSFETLASTSSLAVADYRGRPLGNNASHTAAYRQCYLHPHTNKFTLPPSNFVLSKRGFIYFEIPKVGEGSPRQERRAAQPRNKL